ncbi:MAG: DUF1080 domain-containing protein [Verrucomicrobia bacterium]|nr:DUF1080 domain-containing protein [Verrucomicrobiota bacterium]
MKFYRPLLALATAALVAGFNASAADNELTDQEKADGYVLIFNGKDLTGWEARPEFWSVKDGAICGKTTADCIPKQNTFCICKAGEFGDFELHAKFKLTPGDEKGFANSGIQYRSKVWDADYCVVGGYQGDMEAGKNYTGILYEERGRGILAKRGQKVVIKEGSDPKNPKKPKLEVTGSTGNSDEIQASIKQGDWNDYVIIAKGNHLQQFVNGKQTVDVTDETAAGAKTGIIALQIHKGPPMNACFKDLKIKKLSAK